MHPLLTPLVTDRDLVVLEPLLFGQAQINSQRLIDAAPVSIAAPISPGAGNIVAATGTPPDWSQLGIAVGDIAQLSLASGASTLAEVIAINDLVSGQITVARLSGDVSPADPSGPRSALLPSASATLTIDSFAPQRGAAHASLLSALGLAGAAGLGARDPDAGSGPIDIANRRELWLLGACHTLALIFDALPPSAAPAGATTAERAAQYRRRAALLRGTLPLWVTLASGRVVLRSPSLSAGLFVRA